MIKLLTKGWRKEFFDLVKSAEEEIIICSPFIKTYPVKQINQNLNPQINLKVLTSFKLPYFIRNVSELNALDILLTMGEVRSVGNLHSKVYIFDNAQAIITSANLTYNGLNKNVEHGLYTSDYNLVKTIKEDILNLYNNEDLSTVITKEKIDETRNLLSEIKKHYSFKYKEVGEIVEEEIDATDVLFKEEISIIKEKLSPWQRDVFDILSDIKKCVVTLGEIYSYEIQLQEKHPDNKHIREKIRQQLQQLRDKGLIEFMDRGVYRKLWL